MTVPRDVSSSRLGDGDAPLLHFAHANGFNAETCRGLLAPLSGRLRIVASDARGHGRTTLPATSGLQQGWTIFRDDLIAVLDLIAQEGAILAGHSRAATASLDGRGDASREGAGRSC